MAEQDSRAYRPCVKCGEADRYKSGYCRPCAIAISAAWRTANPEKAKAVSDAYRAANLEKEKVRYAACRAANADKRRMAQAARRAADPERERAIKASWRAANPEKGKAYRQSAQEIDARRIRRHNREARKRDNGGTLSKGLSEKLFKLQKGRCACCGLSLGDGYHMDHIMPIALGGPNTDGNIQLLRQRCNNQKCAKHPIDFMQSRGFLL